MNSQENVKRRRVSESSQENQLSKEPTHFLQFNPLLNDLILDLVFKYVISPSGELPQGNLSKRTNLSEAAKDVKSVRLVCRLWRDRVTHAFRQARSPTEFGVYQFEEYEERTCLPTDCEMSRFVNVMSRSHMPPVERYILNSSIFGPENRQLMTKFINFCLPHISGLQLNLENIDSVYGSLTRSTQLDLWKLRNLHINCAQIGKWKLLPYRTTPNRGFPLFLQLLLESAGNLQEFRLEVASNFLSKAETNEMLEEVCKRVPKSVKQLCLDISPLNDVHLKLLMERNLELEELVLYGCDISRSVSDFYKFLKGQTNSLKSVALRCGESSLSLLSENFPPVEELRLLWLQNSPVVAPISFPDVFLKVSVLNLEGLGGCRETFDLTMKLFSCIRKAATVNELHLPSSSFIPQARLVRRAAQCLPNIKKLHIFFPTDVEKCLQEVFTCLPELEELSVKFICMMLVMDGRVSGDAILSGVPEADCDIISQRGNFAEVNLQSLQRNPSILNLKKLKKLDLINCGTVFFTDFSARLVFLNMASLEELHSTRFEMNSDSADLLRAKLKVLRATFVDETNFAISQSHAFPDEILRTLLCDELPWN